MNYRYVPDPNRALKAIIKKNPAASLHEILHEIRKSHPTLQSMSLDHLSLRFEQLDRNAPYSS